MKLKKLYPVPLLLFGIIVILGSYKLDLFGFGDRPILKIATLYLGFSILGSGILLAFLNTSTGMRFLQDLSSFPSRGSFVNSFNSTEQTLIWAGCILLVILTLLGFWRIKGPDPINVDEDTYDYVGLSWDQGYWPYQHSWDHKGPTVYVTTWLRTTLLGNNTEMRFYQRLFIGLGTSVITSGIAYFLWGGISPAIALAICALLWMKTPYISSVGGLIGLFTSGAVLLALMAMQNLNQRKSTIFLLLMGMLAGLAICTKPNAITGLVMGWVTLIIIYNRSIFQNRMYFIWMNILGVLVPILAFVFLFSNANALDALIDSYILYNSIRGRFFLQQVGILTLFERLWNSLNDVGMLYTILGVFNIVLMTAVISLTSAIRTKIFSSLAFIIPLWLIFELPLMASNGALSYHSFPVLPPAALGATWLIMIANNLISTQSSSEFNSTILQNLFTLLPKLASFLVFFILAIPWLHNLSNLHPRCSSEIQCIEGFSGKTNEWNNIVSDFSKTNHHQDTLFILTWDSGAILNQVNRRNISRYINLIPLMTRGYASNDRWKELLSDLQGSMPERIMVSYFEDEPPRDAITTIKKSLLWFYTHFLPQQVADYPSHYSHREEFVTFIGRNYDLDYCLGEKCILRKISP